MIKIEKGTRFLRKDQVEGVVQHISNEYGVPLFHIKWQGQEHVPAYNSLEIEGMRVISSKPSEKD